MRRCNLAGTQFRKTKQAIFCADTTLNRRSWVRISARKTTYFVTTEYYLLAFFFWVGSLEYFSRLRRLPIFQTYSRLLPTEFQICTKDRLQSSQLTEIDSWVDCWALEYMGSQRLLLEIEWVIFLSIWVVRDYPHPKTLIEIAMVLSTNRGSFPSDSHVSATFSILLRFGESWNPTNCEKFNADGSLMGRTNLDKSVW